MIRPLLTTFVALPLAFAVACGETQDPPDDMNTGGDGDGGTGKPSAGATATGGRAGVTPGVAGEGGVPGSEAGAGATEGGQSNAGAGQGGDVQGGGGPIDATQSVLDAKLGDLVISEIMRDPKAVDDALGEWFEIYNATSHAIELAGLTLADGTGSVAVTGNALIAAHGYAVFARGAVGNGGVNATFVYGDVLQLANTADVVRISVNGSLLDEVAFDTAKGFPDIAGASLSFAAGVPTPLSNDAVANWCAAGKIFGAGDLGSPGAANTCLSKAEDLRAGDLVITEIMANPDAVDDLVGEWFELLNRTSTGFDLKGLTVTDAGIDSFTIASSLIAFPGARVVLGVSSTLATNGGIPVDYVYARAQFAIANTEDELIVSNTSVIDAVAYTTEFPATAGASMSLAPGSSTAIANDSAGNWCTATSALASGDHATPGAANDACL